ncbi:P63C domain-containing protein [Winogradskyella tangerina]|uniref:P63C domain-containing protein n=1 Tax=Winogradskyella tangerina TaxID=2023240 RepID=UPI000DBE3B7C|nr:P63C domain-containing protein [Winogradskyella tangerina]
MKEKKLKNVIQANTKELKELQRKEEIQTLLFRTESLRPQKDYDKELEKIQLRNGTTTSLKEIKDLINDIPREHESMFPNEKPFFSLMFYLNEWNDLNPHNFIKPPICAKWIKQYIYGRFDREVLPTLLKKENPIIAGYIKKYKLFQFLNDDGLMLLEGYINDAIEVMKISKNWYDFELKYTKLYTLSVQLKLKLK